MSPTREEIRREQEKIAPGSGLGARFDRGAWAATGARKAGEWNWIGLLSGVATFAVLAIVVIFAFNATAIGLIGGIVGYAILLARGRYLHDRYVKRTGGG